MKVINLLTTKPQGVITIQPQQTLKSAAQILAEKNIGALVVVDDGGQLVGILSERDIIRRAGESDDVLAAVVGDVMTPNPVVGSPDDDMMSVASTMTDGRFRHLPILADGALIGIISIGDILKAQRDRYRGERNTLETQIMAE